MPTGNVQITVNDANAAAILVPGANVALLIGNSSAGTVNQIVATQNQTTLQTNLGYGPLVELGALLCAQGATVLAIKVPNNTLGTVTGASIAAVNITSITNASPQVVLTATAHGFTTGDVITIAGVTTDTTANATWVITVVDSTHFSLNGSTAGGAGTGGTATPTGVVFTGTGTSLPTVTLSGTVGAYDDYYIQLTVTTGGTIGTGPIGFTLSLDAGRTVGPIIQLGTATTYAIPNTGVTLNFGSGTLVTGDIIRLATTAPIWNTAGVQSALQAFQASQYAISGVGSVTITGPMTGSTCSTIEGYFDTLATGYIFDRFMVGAADVTTPAAWGGAGGQTESTWITSIQTSYASVSAKRACVSAGYYNTPSQYGNPVAGAPIYRRPLMWSQAARQVAIAPQEHSGRVSLGALGTIIVNPTTDPTDGFVYHDERINSGFDAARFCSAWTRVGLPGFYILNPNLMSPAGSTLTLLPLGNVLDVACDIIHQVGQQEIDSNIRLNPNGTIYINDALYLQSAFSAALRSQMVGTNMISGFTVSVDQTTNVGATSIVLVNVSIQSRGYVLQENVTIGFNTVA
jgi:hypothetical protein